MAYEKYKGTHCQYCGEPYEFGEYIWLVKKKDDGGSPHRRRKRRSNYMTTCIPCRNLVLKEKAYPKPHQDAIKDGRYVCIGGLAITDGFKQASKKWDEHVRT